MIAALLTKISAHFPRQNQNEAMARSVIEDFCDDLEPYAMHKIVEAFRIYRTDPASKFFPTPGQILKIIKAEFPPDTKPPAFKSIQYQPPGLPKSLPSIPEVLRKNGELQAAEYFEQHGTLMRKRLGPIAKARLRELGGKPL